MQNKNILLVYDKECPLCDNYCQMVRIQKSIGTLILVNARDKSEVMDEVTRLGLDIDQGMVLKMQEKIYYGADAIHALALISSRSGFLNRLSYWLFSNKYIAAILYPLFKFFRNMLLKMLKVKKIDNLGNSKQTYF